jgi:hypothetical protein
MNGESTVPLDSRDLDGLLVAAAEAAPGERIAFRDAIADSIAYWPRDILNHDRYP